jgi:hypothetical protein
MKTLAALAVFVAAWASLPYFKYQRPVASSGPGQRYIVVDETMWAHARPDLEDLRLYAGATETPYMLVVEQGSVEHDHHDVPVLQQSSVGGKTQFLIEMSALAEYDHVKLRLATRDFVAHARTEGQDNLHAQRWASLGDSILYDLSKENLGANTMLRLPRSTYKYLRVTIDGPVKPDDVSGATSETRQEQKPVWRDVTRVDGPQQRGRESVLTFRVPDNVPVERLILEIDPAQPNFRRDLEIQDETGRIIGSGEVNRIHLVRQGRKIDSEQDEASLYGRGRKTVEVIIHNGDDPPLKVTGARLQQYERRIYFASGGSPLLVYYGDEKLPAPVYDYAKLFQEDPNAAEAQLGMETANVEYAARPDERPWSERHPAVLWAAIVAAVLVLGALALRSMKASSA